MGGCQRNICIYGAGKGGLILLEELRKAKMTIECFIDKNYKIIKSVDSYEVRSVECINSQKDFIVISLMTFQWGIVNQLNSYGYKWSDFYYVCAGQWKAPKDTTLYGCEIGAYTQFVEHMGVNGENTKSIGRFCSISPTVRLITGFHDCERVSTSHYFGHPIQNEWEDMIAWEERGINWLEKSNKKTRIGNDVWIGDWARIKQGVSISDGAVVAAGAIVVKDVEPYEIVGGVPARHIKYRFQPKVLEELLKIKWWNWEMGKIEKEKYYFADVETFIIRNKKNI